MAEFKQLIITNKGQSLMAKMVAGTGNVKFTKIAVSDTTYTDAQLYSLTSISGIKQSTAISKVARTNNVAVQIEGAVTNLDLTSGYFMRTIGLYALDPDEGEILYAITIASTAGYMPPYNGITSSGAFFKLVTTVSNASNVSLNVDPSAVATIGDLKELRSKIDSLQKVVDDNQMTPFETDVLLTPLTGCNGGFVQLGTDTTPAIQGRTLVNLSKFVEVSFVHGSVYASNNTEYIKTLNRQVTIINNIGKEIYVTVASSITGMALRQIVCSNVLTSITTGVNEIISDVGGTTSKGWTEANKSDLLKVMVLDGTVTAPPTSYFEGMCKVGAKNEFDGQLEIGALNPDGTPYATDSCIRSKNFIKVYPDEVYTLSYNINTTLTNVIGYDENFKATVGFNLYDIQTFRIPANCRYIKFRINGTDLNLKVQLERGDKATSYIPPNNYRIEILSRKADLIPAQQVNFTKDALGGDIEFKNIYDTQVGDSFTWYTCDNKIVRPNVVVKAINKNILTVDFGYPLGGGNINPQERLVPNKIGYKTEILSASPWKQWDNIDKNGVITRGNKQINLDGVNYRCRDNGSVSTNATLFWVANINDINDKNGEVLSPLFAKNPNIISTGVGIEEGVFTFSNHLYISISNSKTGINPNDSPTVKETKVNAYLSLNNIIVNYEIADNLKTYENSNKTLIQRGFPNGYLQVNAGPIQPNVKGSYSTNICERFLSIEEAVQSIIAQLGGTWKTLLALADRELRMKAINLLTTETVTDLKNKINEILNVWR